MNINLTSVLFCYTLHVFQWTGNIKLTSVLFCYTLHVFQWTAVVVDWEYKVNECVVVIHYMFFSGLGI